MMTILLLQLWDIWESKKWKDIGKMLNLELAKYQYENIEDIVNLVAITSIQV